MRDFRHRLDGELLGDGCVYIRGKRINAEYRHMTARKGHLDWLQPLFEAAGYTVRRRKQERSRMGTPITSYGLRTWVDERLTEQRERWYPNGKKRVPEDIELEPETLLHWYLGDGSYRPDGTTFIATNGFDDRSMEILTEKMDAIGVETNIWSQGELHIDSWTRSRFFEYMAPLPDELESVYGYKFPDEQAYNSDRKPRVEQSRN